MLKHLTDLNMKSSKHKQYLTEVIDNPGTRKVEEISLLPAVVHDGWMMVNTYLDTAYKIQVDIENEKRRSTS